MLLGNIHRYWVVSLLGDIFCCSYTQYNTNQRAVSTVHMPVSDYLVQLLTCRCNHLSGHHADMLLFIIIVIIIDFWDFCGHCYALHKYQYWVLGIARGQYYWVLDIGCLSWYRSNPSHIASVRCIHNPVYCVVVQA